VSWVYGLERKDQVKERDEGLLTAKEAARYLGISLPTLARIEKRGDLLPYRTPGGHRRYSMEMLAEYLENSRNYTSLRRTPAEGPSLRRPNAGAS